MSSAHDHGVKAKRFLQMASEAEDPQSAEALRILAASQLESAQDMEASRPVGQQQSQIARKEPEAKER
jgi:hypothetical protein